MQDFYSEYKPDYTIKDFGGSGVYSVCRFNRSGFESCKVGDRGEQQYNDKKLDNAFSRARSMILQYGLSNRWDYFATFTLDKNKYDRYDFERFRSAFNQFILDLRKKYAKAGCCDAVGRLSYLVVPEMHKDGAWHMHGLISGIPPCRISKFESGKHPEYLVKHNYMNWPDYAEKFGFVSLGKIRDQYATVLYTVKYINKSMDDLADMKGKHLYSASRPLRKALTVSHVYGPDSELDACLDWHGKFCSTGMVKDKDWVWPLEKDNMAVYDDLFPKEEPAPDLAAAPFDPATIDCTYEHDLFEFVMMG